MKTKQEIKKWLLENCLNEDGNLVMCDIDLSKFKGKVILKGWKIGGNADLSSWEVKGNLYQHCQEVKGNLEQSYQVVKGNLYQNGQKVDGNLYQHCQTAEDLYQNCQNVSKDLVSQKLKEDEEWVSFERSDCAVIRAKKLKEISLDELAEMGYKLKEKN